MSYKWNNNISLVNLKLNKLGKKLSGVVLGMVKQDLWLSPRTFYHTSHSALELFTQLFKRSVILHKLDYNVLLLALVV